MPLDTARYPITPEDQQVLLIEAYGDGAPARIDEVLKAVCRARGLIPTRPQPNPVRPVNAVEPFDLRRPLRTPGEVLAHLFMARTGLSGKRLAAELGVPRSRVTDILHGARGITAQTAILLGRRFGNPPEFWLRLQMYHDLAIARRAMASSPVPCPPPRPCFRLAAPPAE
jgi:addiction module HigA family antidote